MLADQFNVTAAQLEAQRARLLGIQAGLEDEVARRIRQLEDANGRLRRLDEMRMLFLADIGHELRTPLTILRGEESVAAHRETLQHIVQLTGQMGRLIGDLLFLSRAEVGAVRFQMRPVAVQDVLDIALAEGRILAAANGLLVRSVMPPGPCVVRGDAERLVQALLIAIDNAVKYADADDYMAKPFAFDEFVARVEALLRRGALQRHDPVLRVADLTLDPMTRQIRRGDRPVELTRKEYGLLRYLMENAGAVLSRAQLLNANWGYNFDPGTKVVGVYIRYLRKKIDEGEETSLIQTIRGAGYTIGARG